MTGNGDVAAWGKRLRREQPPDVFFIDPELREPLEQAAASRGCTVPGLIKRVVRNWLEAQGATIK